MTRKLLGLLEALFLVLAAMAVLFPRWIEVATGLDPDKGSGLLEVVVAVALVCAGLGVHLLRVRRLLVHR